MGRKVITSRLIKAETRGWRKLQNLSLKIQPLNNNNNNNNTGISLEYEVDMT
jgi:hypothetical protein